MEKHRELGGRTEVDVAFQYLKFFMEDDEELERIRQAYEKGEIDLHQSIYRSMWPPFQERRAKVTEEVRKEFMSERPLAYGGNPNPIVVEKTPKASKREQSRKELE
jgi:tryptophanyl-tRNA synthetase